MFSDISYKLKVNFDCPRLHDCKVFQSLEACQKEVDATISAVTKKCIEATSTFLGKAVYTCGYDGLGECLSKDEVLPGPKRFVSVIQPERQETHPMIFIACAVVVCGGLYTFYKNYKNN